MFKSFTYTGSQKPSRPCIFSQDRCIQLMPKASCRWPSEMAFMAEQLEDKYIHEVDLRQSWPHSIVAKISGRPSYLLSKLTSHSPYDQSQGLLGFKVFGLSLLKSSVIGHDLFQLASASHERKSARNRR